MGAFPFTCISLLFFFSPLLPALPSSYLSAGFAGSSYLLPISGVLRYMATLLPKSFTSGVRGGDTVVNWILVFTGPHTHASRTHTTLYTEVESTAALSYGDNETTESIILDISWSMSGVKWVGVCTLTTTTTATTPVRLSACAPRDDHSVMEGVAQHVNVNNSA